MADELLELKPGVTTDYQAVVDKCDAAIREAVLKRSTVQEVSGSIASILRAGVTAEEYERNLRSMFRSGAGR